MRRGDGTMKDGRAPITSLVVNKPFRNFYKRKTAHIKDKRTHEYINDRIISLFCRKLAHYMIEHRAGVHINRLGYFFVYRHPFRFPPRTGYYQNLKRYMPTFIPTENSILKYWSLDFAMNPNIYKNLNKKIAEGQRYLNLMLGVSKKDYMYLGAPNRAIRMAKLREQKNVI